MPVLQALVFSIDSFAKIVQLRETLSMSLAPVKYLIDISFSRHINIHGSRLPHPSTPKGNKFEILFLKLFSLKQKANQILQATIEKIKFRLYKKTSSYSFRQTIAIGKCKTKAIQADLSIFTNIPVYSGILRHI